MTEGNQGEPGGRMGKIIVGIVIVAIVVGGYMYFKNSKTSNGMVVDSSKYQAVFLTNGQTYFGKVVNPNEKYVSVTDVFYLVLKQPLQNQNTDQNQNQDPVKPEYSLIKLGKELHGPTSMSINKDQILFIENLADDSKVVSAINNTQK